jgi:tetratricopeptide (TPR) repeat protein
MGIYLTNINHIYLDYLVSRAPTGWQKVNGDNEINFQLRMLLASKRVDYNNQELTCPFTQELFTDPVSFYPNQGACEQVFAFRSYLVDPSKPPISPLNNRPYTHIVRDFSTRCLAMEHLFTLTKSKLTCDKAIVDELEAQYQRGIDGYITDAKKDHPSSSMLAHQKVNLLCVLHEKLIYIFDKMNSTKDEIAKTKLKKDYDSLQEDVLVSRNDLYNSIAISCSFYALSEIERYFTIREEQLKQLSQSNGGIVFRLAPHPLTFGDLYLQIESYPDALQRFEQLLENKKDSLDVKAKRSIIVKRAMCLIGMEKYDKATELLDTLPKTEPKELDVVVPFAQLYLAKGQYDEALKLLEPFSCLQRNTEKIDINTIEILRGLGQCYLALKMYQNVKELYEKLSELYKKLPVFKVLYGKYIFATSPGDNKVAYENIIDVYINSYRASKDVEVLLMVSRYYAKYVLELSPKEKLLADTFCEAKSTLQILEAMKEHGEIWAEIFANCGAYYKAKKDVHNAVVCCKKSLDCNPNNITALENFGDIFVDRLITLSFHDHYSDEETRLLDLKNAVDIYAKVLKLVPQNFKVLKKLTEACYYLEQWAPINSYCIQQLERDREHQLEIVELFLGHFLNNNISEKQKKELDRYYDSFIEKYHSNFRIIKYVLDVLCLKDNVNYAKDIVAKYFPNFDGNSFGLIEDKNKKGNTFNSGVSFFNSNNEIKDDGRNKVGIPRFAWDKIVMEKDDILLKLIKYYSQSALSNLQQKQYLPALNDYERAIKLSSKCGAKKSGVIYIREHFLKFHLMYEKGLCLLHLQRVAEAIKCFSFMQQYVCEVGEQSELVILHVIELGERLLKEQVQEMQPEEVRKLREQLRKYENMADFQSIKNKFVEPEQSNQPKPL